MCLEKLDVKTAFLHSNLEEQIFMRQLEEYVKEGDEKKVCLLRKSLYRLKQSPRQWYLWFDEFTVTMSIREAPMTIMCTTGG